MDFRVFVHKRDDVFEAWAPDLHDVRALGPTEEAAVKHVQEAIQAAFVDDVDQDRLPDVIVERHVDVEIHPPTQNKPETRRPGEPTREIAKGKATIGAGLIMLGVTGVIFAFMAGIADVTPISLFAPILVVAFGVLGVIMGMADAANVRRRA